MDWLGDILGTGVSAAAGGLLGGLLRLIPAGIDYFKAKADRAHELAMRTLDIKAAKDIGEQRLREIDATGGWDVKRGEMEAWATALRAQSTPTGVAWIDALNASVRPVVTYWFMALYTAMKVALYFAARDAGAEAGAALLAIWTAADSATFFGILGFWFVDRQLGKTAASK